LRNWLYRITTTTCLKMINGRRRDPLADTVEVAWLQPYPDALLDELPADDADPAGIAERRESVALAFIVALQLLPATQRAVLILREVLGWPAREVADLLDTTVAGVNSALQRARATLTTATPATHDVRGPLDRHQQRVLDAFLRAWHACDVPALAALLRDDVILTMPPQAIRIAGRDAVAAFFATVPAEGRLDLIRLVVTRANGHPALAAYLPDASTGDCRGYGIMVLTTDGDYVTSITGFPDPDLFPTFDLPNTLRETDRPRRCYPCPPAGGSDSSAPPPVRLGGRGHQARSRSSVTPSPVRSSRVAVWPVMAMTMATVGPLASGPVPWIQPVSVARRRTPVMRFLAPISRLLPA
jgi:RNA polymerase sigma-70 factor (ECF subfamily)